MKRGWMRYILPVPKKHREGKKVVFISQDIVNLSLLFLWILFFFFRSLDKLYRVSCEGVFRLQAITLT